MIGGKITYSAGSNAAAEVWSIILARWLGPLMPYMMRMISKKCTRCQKARKVHLLSVNKHCTYIVGATQNNKWIGWPRQPFIAALSPGALSSSPEKGVHPRKSSAWNRLCLWSATQQTASWAYIPTLSSPDYWNAWPHIQSLHQYCQVLVLFHSSLSPSFSPNKLNHLPHADWS